MTSTNLAVWPLLERAHPVGVGSVEVMKRFSQVGQPARTFGKTTLKDEHGVDICR